MKIETKIINSIEDKFGKPNDKGICTPFWGVQFADGGKATIWDDGIALTAKNNIGKEIELEIKTTPSGYSNIRALNIATGNVPVEHIKVDNVQEVPCNAPSEPKAAPNPQRVGLYIKLAVEMAIKYPAEIGEKNIEEVLCENVQISPA